ncbi:AMP-binding protein [Maritimibacter sp. DP1N21-5]|uniref:AMP-binding protein n=1 Tax=Maritimibacter sp. DP1N21-5 TaxID=2836867 RepID=UPI001C449FDA|nr:AMP-binding protein [Maritimibacter sp. DP1N21-5]MBV7407461.1 AMP-binding protein [Maritimibacter sp. DP1N21-5]
MRMTDQDTAPNEAADTAESLAEVIAARARSTPEAPALGDLTYRDLADSIAPRHEGPVVAFGKAPLADLLAPVFAALATSAVAVGAEGPFKRTQPGELVLPIRREDGGIDFARHRQTALLAMARALATRFALSPHDRVWIDGSVTDPATWMIACAALAAGAHISLDETDATVAWQLRGGTPLSTPDLRLIHLRAPREALAALQSERPSLTVVNGFALPEAGGLPITSDPRDPPATVPGTVGRPLAGMEVMIVDPRSGMDMLLYQTGEVWLRGPGLVAGFANGIAPFEPGHFLRTGVLGYLDSEGRLVLPRTEEEALHIEPEDEAD